MPAKKTTVSTLPWLSDTTSIVTTTVCVAETWKSATIRYAFVRSANLAHATASAEVIVTCDGWAVPFWNTSARQRGSAGLTTRAYAVRPCFAERKIPVDDET